MKNSNIFFLEDEEDEPLSLGFLRLVKPIPPHEFFFQVNKMGHLSCQRIKDLRVENDHFLHTHTVFEAYDMVRRCKILFIENHSNHTEKIREFTELFVKEETENYLFPEKKDVDYIIKTSENIEDFSVILLPKNLTFSIQNYLLNSNDGLYHLIQYYE